MFMGLGWWWVDEKERKIERRRTKLKREVRRERFFYINLFCNLYYFNILEVKIKVRMLGAL